MILIVAEHEAGRASPVNEELIRWGRQISAWRGGEVAVALLGRDVGALADQLAAPVRAEGAGHRADRVIVVDDDALADYTAEGYAGAVARLAAKFDPFIVIAAHTSTGYDFMPRVAARLERPLVPGCVRWEPEGDRMLLTRQIFNARLHMRVGVEGAPALATALPGAFSSDPARAAGKPEASDDASEGSASDAEDIGSPAEEAGENDPSARPGGVVPAIPPGEPLPIDAVSIDFSDLPIRVSVVERGQAPKGSVDLSAAEVIVAAGRGIKEQENLAIVRDLADALGGAVAASRPVVDAEWMPREYQIGSSGQTVAPKLYVAVGISGAVQHLVGMQSARCIVAINKDADAPIFKVAHYGIVDDLFKVVPEITQTIRALRGAGGPKPV